jgi:peptidyl-prolyl cis-trans isomerase C
MIMEKDRMSLSKKWMVLPVTVVAIVAIGAYFADAAEKTAATPKAEPAKVEAKAADATATATATPAPAAKPAATLSPDTTVAKVNGEAVKGSEVLTLKNNLRAPASSMPLDMLYPALVDRMIDTKLVNEAAKKAKLADDKEVKDRVKQAQDKIIQDIYLQREVASKVNEQAIAERYKKMAAEFKPQSELKASHILVASEAEAKDISAKLKAGADFAQIARDKSTDKASATNGGRPGT